MPLLPPPPAALPDFVGGGFGVGIGAGDVIAAAALGAGVGRVCAGSSGSGASTAGDCGGLLVVTGSMAGTGLLNARLGSTCTTSMMPH